MIRLSCWERGLALWPADNADLRMYLWFYEWNLFGAVAPGQYTRGYWCPDVEISEDHRRAELHHPDLHLTAVATEDGAQLTLAVENATSRHWPEAAAIVPCFNPGKDEPNPKVPPTDALLDPSKTRTWFLGSSGLAPLTGRSIHFTPRFPGGFDRPFDELSAPPEKPAADNAYSLFEFSPKWPTDPMPAEAGLVVRESADGTWVTGIGWEEYLSVQGHNPWNCMHLSVRVGPLAPGAKRIVRGHIYLFPGTKEACLERYLGEFLQR